MLEDVFVDLAARRRLRSCVLARHLEDFCVMLADRGHRIGTIRQKISLLGRLARWMQARGLGVGDLDERRARAFVDARSRQGWRRRRGVEQTVLQLIEHLRAAGALVRPAPTRDDSPAAVVLARYVAYLRDERGLAPCTLAAYGFFVRPFVVKCLADGAASAAALRAGEVRDFLLTRTRDVPPRRAQAIAIALRSFVRFLFLRGETSIDLGRGVTTEEAAQTGSQVRGHDTARAAGPRGRAVTSPTLTRRDAIPGDLRRRRRAPDRPGRLPPPRAGPGPRCGRARAVPRRSACVRARRGSHRREGRHLALGQGRDACDEHQLVAVGVADLPHALPAPRVGEGDGVPGGRGRAGRPVRRARRAADPAGTAPRTATAPHDLRPGASAARRRPADGRPQASRALGARGPARRRGGAADRNSYRFSRHRRRPCGGAKRTTRRPAVSSGA